MNVRNTYLIHGFNELKARLLQHPPFNENTPTEEDVDFLQQFDLLLENLRQQHTDYSFTAQSLLTRQIRCYPQFTPLIKRELLWFIGGDCLHFLGDEEIEMFQGLEEHLYLLEQSNQCNDLATEIHLYRQQWLAASIAKLQ